LIIPDTRNESNPVSQRGEIVRHNRGRAAEREHHSAGQKFAVAGKLFWQAVENQIEVQFARNGDVKAAASFRCP